jgi:hypothetical protein
MAPRDRRPSTGHEQLSKGDQLIERGAARLEELSRNAAAKGGFSAKLADELAEDAAFLRKLKPSLIKARARGDAPTDQPPGEGRVAPSSPQLGKRPSAAAKGTGGGGGPNPWLVLVVCVAAGIAAAKWIDWRGHAHPRD